MVKVVVVILNFKVKQDTLDCVASVKKSDYKDLEIIVVDNNSEDGIEEELQKMAEVNFIQTHQNLGYTGGNNIGIKRALQKGADYIFILNPDTLIKKNTVSDLVLEAEKNKIDIAGPKILFSDQKTIWYAGGIFDKLNVIGKHRGIDEKDQNQYEKIEETDYTSGAAMLVKQSVFNKIGFFDERFFLYYEDSDFCLRAHDEQFKIMFVPKAVVIHKNAHSTGLGSTLQDYFITRNRMLLASKFLKFRTRFALLREAFRNLGNPVRRLALFDFLTGNFGKGSFLS